MMVVLAAKNPMNRMTSVASRGEEHAEHGGVDLRAPQQHVGVEDGEGEQDPAEILIGRRGVRRRR
jgi:hypothetical protein